MARRRTSRTTSRSSSTPPPRSNSITIEVENSAKLDAALAHTSDRIRRDVLASIRKAAEPIRQDAQTGAVRRIDRMTLPWSRMRTGLTKTGVYVAPRERGVARGHPRARPRFAPLMAIRALRPALKVNDGRTMRDVEAAVGRAVKKFNRGTA